MILTASGTPPLRLTTNRLPGARLGAAYEAQLTATGGMAPYSFALGGGSLPPGLTLNADGRVTGTATATGDFSFNVVITDATNCQAMATAALKVVTHAAPTVVISPPTVVITPLSGGVVSAMATGADGRAVTTRWEADDPAVGLGTPNAPTTRVFAARPGSYTLRCVVSDGDLETVGTATLEVLPCDGQPVDLVLVIDTSTSMLRDPDGSPWAAFTEAKATARRLIEGLRPTDRVAVVEFNSSGVVRSPLGAPREAALAAVEALTAEGSASFVYDGLTAAQAELAARGAPGARPVIVTLTDGIWPYWPETPDGIKAAGIRLITLGFGFAGDFDIGGWPAGMLENLQRMASSRLDVEFRRLTRRAGEPPGPPPVEMADAVRQRLCILNGAPLVRIAPVPPVYLPETALLTATATDDGPTLVYRWRLASGPGAVAFDRPDTAVTRAAFGQGGTYVLEVAVSDGQYVATAQVSVVVHGPGSVNAPPVVTATAATPLRLGGNLLEAVAGDEEWDAQDRPRGVTAAAGNWRRPPLGAPGVPAPFAGTTYLWVEGIQPHLTWRVDLTALERPDLYDIVLSVRGRLRTDFAGTGTLTLGATVVEYVDGPGPIGSLFGGVTLRSDRWATYHLRFALPGNRRRIRTYTFERLFLTTGQPPCGFALDAVSIRLEPRQSAPETALGKLAGTVADDGLPSPPRQTTAQWAVTQTPGTPPRLETPERLRSETRFDAAGDYGFTLSATDGALTTTATTTVTVLPALTVNLGPAAGLLPDAREGDPYAVTFTATGGVAPYTYELLYSGGQHPPGWLVFDETTGVYAGTPPLSGTLSFQVRVTDREGRRAANDYTLRIVGRNCQPLTISPATLPGATAGQAYNVQLSANTQHWAGAGFVVVAGTLPPGIALQGNRLQGTPTAVGTYAFTVEARDVYNCTGRRDYTLTVTPLNCGLTITSPPPPPGLVGTSYQRQWTTGGGNGTVSFAVASGTLPPGLTLTPAGVLQGTPTTAGSYAFTVRATDAVGCQATQAVTLEVAASAPPPTVALTFPADGGRITAPTVARGTVSFAVGSGTWKLELADGGEAETESPLTVWRTVATGTGNVTDGALGTLDPTLLMNGLYTLRLSATDVFERTFFVTQVATVERGMKVGAFTVAFQDVSVAVGGVPVEVTRTYDSRERERVGEFGYGWSLAVGSGVRVQRSGVLGRGWRHERFGILGAGLVTYRLTPRAGNLVTVTLPGGKVYKFRPTATPSQQVGAPITTFALSFAPADATTRGTLVPLTRAGRR